MKTLHLLRHAKSSWDDASLPDVERPLAPRGRTAADALRGHLAGTVVDLVLVSPARRAQETWERIADGVRARAVRTEPAIYEAEVADLLALIRATDEADTSLLVVGHDPGLGRLAAALPGAGDDALLAQVDAKFPTGAFATITFDGRWSQVADGRGRLVEFVRPRDL